MKNEKPNNNDSNNNTVTWQMAKEMKSDFSLNCARVQFPFLWCDASESRETNEVNENESIFNWCESHKIQYKMIYMLLLNYCTIPFEMNYIQL